MSVTVRAALTVAAIAIIVALAHHLTRQPTDRPVPFNAPLPHSIRGNSVTDIGSIRVPPNTILHWHCPECGPPTRYWAGSTFQVMNDQNDPQLLLMGINALGQTGGQEILSGGTYHDVYVETATAHWSLSFTREPKTS